MTQDNNQGARSPDQVLGEFLDTLVKEHPTLLWQHTEILMFHLIASRVAVNWANTDAIREKFSSRIRKNTVDNAVVVEITPTLERAINNATDAAVASGMRILAPNLIDMVSAYDAANNLSESISNLIQECVTKLVDSSFPKWEI